MQKIRLLFVASIVKAAPFKNLLIIFVLMINKQIYVRISKISPYLSENDKDTSKKVVDYNINENQFAIEYIAIFEDGTFDSFIENKIIRRTAATAEERLPIWVEYIKKKKEEKSNKQHS